MATKFDSRIGAAVLIGLAALYAAGSTAMGKSARSEVPPDWSSAAGDSGIEVWQTVATLADARGALLLDVRGAEDAARFAIPGAFPMPHASAKDVAAKSGYGTIIVIAPSDEAAQKLVGEAKSLRPGADLRFLRGGARSWYLAFEMPVAMFSTKPEPHGYRAAHETAKRFVNGSADLRADAREAAITLAKLNYTPDLLGQGAKPKSAAGGRKKISGGCGG
jgi:rhodanese-related sulfurtransferase